MLGTRRIKSQLGDVSIERKVSRGTPQGGVLSPLIWLLVVDELLKILEREGFIVSAYADDVVILVPGKFTPVLSERLSYALLLVNNWVTGRGLGVNPSKTEILLFTRRRAIPAFNPPRMGGVDLEISKTARYLGVILDSKLSWKENIEDRVKKAYVALYACRRAFGNTWGFRPHVVHWLYTAVVRPILTYGTAVWWKAIEKKYHLSNLTKVQRAACIGITGSIRTTPTAAMEVMLNLTPLDIYCSSKAVKTAIRLRESGLWSSKPYGHASIESQWNAAKEKMTTDYLPPTLVLAGVSILEFQTEVNGRTK